MLDLSSKKYNFTLKYLQTYALHLIFLGLLFIVIIASVFYIRLHSNLYRSAAAAPSFVFNAVGDFGGYTDTTAGLNLIPSSGAAFTLALGDLSYGSFTPESAWCDYIKSKVGNTYPFELISGNHESNGQDGLIDNFAACLPDRIGNITGTYAKEYYFDYPASAPLARFILISPALTFTNGGYCDYSGFEAGFV